MKFKYPALNKSEVSVGDEVFVTFCGRPIGVATKRTIVKIGRNCVTLDTGTKVEFGDVEIGIAKYSTLEENDK